MLALIICFTFIAIALLSAVLLYPLLTRRVVVAERLEKLAPKEHEALALAPPKSPWQELLSRLGKQLPVSPKEQSKYTRMIVAAGFKKERVFIFLGSKILLACILPALYLFLYAFPKGVVLNFDSLLYTAALAIIGFLLPSFWLYRSVENRKTEIFHTLPDILDLVTVCVEAGLGLDAALMKASENPQFVKNPLAIELKTAAMETRAGKPRSEALRDMAERTMEDDVKAFAAMLAQTERFGTSLSQSLRVHADSLRTKRRQIAEEAAAKTAIKMLFPLAFFIFPALLVVMLVPAFFKFVEIFK